MFSFLRNKLKGEAKAEPVQPVAEQASDSAAHLDQAQASQVQESQVSESQVQESQAQHSPSPDQGVAAGSANPELVSPEVTEPRLSEQPVEPVVSPDPSDSLSAATSSVAIPSAAIPSVDAPSTAPEPETQTKPGFFGRLKAGLSRTRSNFTESVANLFLGRKEINDELLEELETLLLTSDVGVQATQEIIAELTAQVSRNELKDGDALMAALKALLHQMLAPVSQPLQIPKQDEPYVVLVVGVNGVGKTTTIGKLAKHWQQQGHSVMLAAGDTFRAAAVEQLKVWGERNQVPVIAQHTGADSASVIFDAVAAAQSRKVGVLMADTAGRLQNKDHLMDELSKVVRVMRKKLPDAPHETLLVLDASTGQNAISQAEIFAKAVGVTGLVITKLDGTAKGGILFALARKFALPVRYIGVGESIDDLRPFDAHDFVEALFSRQD